MSVLPHSVRARLDELAADPVAIQNPNFTPDVLDYHEILALGPNAAATKGSWACDGDEFEFRIVAQISANQTFLGDYGDLMFNKERRARTTAGGTAVGEADIMHAKWKVTFAVPHARSEDGHQQTLRRQFETLRDIQKDDFDSYAVESTSLKCSFVFKSDTQWRASALSDNIFHSHDTPQNDLLPPAGFDSAGHIANLPASVRDKIQVKPLEFFAKDTTAVAKDDIATMFKPGTWIEMRCTLRVWVSRPREHRDSSSSRSSTRSYQLRVNGLQHLAVGRLREGPIRTEPRQAGKRKFSAVS